MNVTSIDPRPARFDHDATAKLAPRRRRRPSAASLGANPEATAAAPAATAQPTSALAALDPVLKLAGWAWSNLVVLRIAAATIAVVFLFVFGVLRGAFLIDPIDIPKELETTGYSREIVAQRLGDEIARIQQATTSYRMRRGFEASVALPDIEVPFAGLPLATTIRALRVFKEQIGFGDPRISGDLTLEGDHYRLALRGNRAEIAGAELNRPKGEFNQLLRDAALAALRMVEPMLVAAYYFDDEFRREQRAEASGQPYVKDFTRSIAIIETILDDPRHRDRVQAFNLYGLILYHRGDEDLAIRQFDLAEHELARAKATDALQIATLYGNWGDALAARGLDAEAAAMYAQAAAHDPQRGSYFTDWGNALSRGGKHREAIWKFERAATLASEDPFPRIGWAEALTRLDKHGLALEKYREAVERERANPALRAAELRAARE